MCVSDKFKDKIDVPFWEKVHQEYMTGVKISEVEAKYGIAVNAMTYYFGKLGFPRRHKNKALLLSQGLKACSKCKEVQSLSNFTIAHHKTKSGDVKPSPSSWCKGCVNKKEIEKRDRLRGKPKELPALEKGFKQCPKCKETKDVSEYSVFVTQKGHKKVCSRCKECRRVESLTANMKESRLERKRETDRIRAKTETGKQINKAAREKYYQSEKGKRWFQERKLSQMVGDKCDVIHVECCVCGCKQIKRSRREAGIGYAIRCSKCNRGCLGLRFSERAIKEVACRSCGLMHMGKSTASRCTDCTKELLKETRKKHKHLHHHRKRARYYGCVYAPLNREYIFERDNYKCYLCSIDVVISKTYRSDQATIDHVIPMSKGGSHTYDNVKTCCNRCNSRKGDKLMKDKGMPASR